MELERERKRKGASVRHPAYRLDASSDVSRIGVVVFDEDITTEDDLARLRGSRDDVSVHISRMPLPTDHSSFGQARTLGDIRHAIARLAPSSDLAVACYACTTGSIELGLDALRRAAWDARPGVQVATPITGAIKLLLRAKASQIALLTPYGDELNRLIADHFSLAGFKTVSLASFKVPAEVDFSRVSQDSLRAAAVEVMNPSADALFVSCTALRATGLIAELEARLRRPVLTSTQAMWWEALTLAGRPVAAANSFAKA